MVAASKSRSLSLLWIKPTLPKEHDERSSMHKGEGRNMRKLPTQEKTRRIISFGQPLRVKALVE